jgi:hypothetical protein
MRDSGSVCRMKHDAQPEIAVARFMVFDIGCIECGEESRVVGFYPTEEEARAAAETYVNPPEGGSSWGREGWIGLHHVEVFDLMEFGK